MPTTYISIRLKIFLFIISIGYFQNSYCADFFTIKGKTSNAEGVSLVGVNIYANKKAKTISASDGSFSISLPKGKATISASRIGYNTSSTELNITNDSSINLILTEKAVRLNEVEIISSSSYEKKQNNSLNISIVNSEYIQTNMQGSLMQTLQRIPGVNAMSIGSGQSKPAIRGLGFNRIVFAENGIKHEAQEWGEDHGLEIDQQSVEEVEIIKGPASLKYGANAIGGVIDVNTYKLPSPNDWGGMLNINAKTNNNSLGNSIFTYGRDRKLFFNARFTWTDYADYKVPIDSIEYSSYYFRLKNKHLRNTAGKDYAGGLTLGYLSSKIKSIFSLTNNYQKSGFFANAHGLEIRTSQINFDASERDIDLPYQEVNHLKISNETSFLFEKNKLKILTAFQNNIRQEFSEAIAHGYMPVPADSLERSFVKNTTTAAIHYQIQYFSKHQLQIGANAEHQQNTIGGWGFIIPQFKSSTLGTFVLDKYQISKKTALFGGLRYDWGRTAIESYKDWFATPTPSGSLYRIRSTNMNKYFENYSAAIGLNYENKQHLLKFNIGKAYRMPTAKELSTNGVNYHLYRYEKGDSSLHAENSYQIDFGYEWKTKKLMLNISPFANYFPNYIYLNPTATYFEGMQIYKYQESEVFRAGGELSIDYNIAPAWNTTILCEYVYSRQLSGNKKGFTIPFSQPGSVILNLKYSPKIKGLNTSSLSIDYKIVAAQNEIVPPETRTDGYQNINLAAELGFIVLKEELKLNLQVQNLMNKVYYDHTSFYRLISVPEPGRNFVVSLQIPFSSNQK